MTDADVNAIIQGIMMGKYDPDPSRYHRPGPRLQSLDRIRRLKEMCAEGLHLKQMAHELGVSPAAVHRLMKRYGILYPYAKGDRS